jgi:hypothetical protein
MKALKVTVVECPGNVTLPNLEFGAAAINELLADLGMPRGKSKVQKDWVRRPRDDKSDPKYSLENLLESKSDILGLYSPADIEVTLYVDSCSQASKDLSLSLDDLSKLCSFTSSRTTRPHVRS